MMGITKELNIINIKILELSNKFLFDMRNKFNSSDKVFNKLPPFVINHKGNLIETECHLQFTGLFDDKREEKFKFIDITYNDENLSEEFSYNGIVSCFKEIDFNKIISQTPSLSLTTEDDFKHHRMFRSNYFIFETTYFVSYSYEYGDELDDIHFNLIGYLDNNMNKILYSQTN